MKKIIEVLLIIIVLFLGGSVFLLSNHIGGWRAFVVLSPSMEPAIKTGSLIISHQVRPNTLRVHDIITFIPPIKNREFITHRISKVSQNKRVVIFKTKGDKNKTEDSWVLAGGGVVGEVVYAIPGLGYFMSFAQSKVGIIIFILLPAAYIIIGEIFNIINTIKNHRKKNLPPAQQVAVVIVFLFLNMIFFDPTSTRALLSDSVSLGNNSFGTGMIPPSPTPTPTPPTTPQCGGNTQINISGNGAGSSNLVNVSSNCSTIINQSNSTTIINSVNTQTSTGGN